MIVTVKIMFSIFNDWDKKLAFWRVCCDMYIGGHLFLYTHLAASAVDLASGRSARESPHNTAHTRGVPVVRPDRNGNTTLIIPAWALVLLYTVVNNTNQSWCDYWEWIRVIIEWRFVQTTSYVFHYKLLYFVLTYTSARDSQRMTTNL